MVEILKGIPASVKSWSNGFLRIYHLTEPPYTSVVASCKMYCVKEDRKYINHYTLSQLFIQLSDHFLHFISCSWFVLQSVFRSSYNVRLL